MANPDHPGGGVEHGCIAQEESLFRRSNYHLTLKSEIYPSPLYPIELDELIYSPNVHIKSETQEGLYLDFVASAALAYPWLPYSLADH